MMTSRATKVSLLAILLVQWGQIGLMIWLRHTMLLFYESLIGGSLPCATILTICITSPAVLFTAGILTTILLLVVELKTKTERTRFVLQIVDACGWSLLTALVTFVFLAPFLMSGVKIV